MARKKKAEAKLAKAIAEKSTFRGHFPGRPVPWGSAQKRMVPTKWVVRPDYTTDTASPGQPPKREVCYVVVGLNDAGDDAKIGLRTTDKREADRAATLLNRQLKTEG